MTDNALDWLEVSVATRSESVEAVSEMLMRLGAGGVVIEDPRLLARRIHELGPALIDEPGAVCQEAEQQEEVGASDTEVIVKAYLDPGISPEMLVALTDRVQALRDVGLDPGQGRVSARLVHSEDWAHAWRRYYKPLRIGRNLLIVPSWLTPQPEPADTVITLDPGMAFGTGTHPTTQLCLAALEDLITPGMDVLDLGTGSGILGIAAAKLGARVRALDIDPRAAAVAADNIQRNGVVDKVTVGAGTLDAVADARFDLIVANIVANTIVELLPRVGGYLHSEGFFVASGIVLERLGEVREAWEESSLVLVEERRLDDWFCMIGQVRQP